MVCVRSTMVLTFIAGGMTAVSCGHRRLDLIDGVDDVGAGLLEHQQDHGWLVVLPAPRC